MQTDCVMGPPSGQRCLPTLSWAVKSSVVYPVRQVSAQRKCPEEKDARGGNRSLGNFVVARRVSKFLITKCTSSPSNGEPGRLKLSCCFQNNSIASSPRHHCFLYISYFPFKFLSCTLFFVIPFASCCSLSLTLAPTLYSTILACNGNGF